MIIIKSVSKEIFLEMFKLGILSTGKQEGFQVTRKQNPNAKDRIVEEPKIEQYYKMKRKMLESNSK
jgi:hypothetical protein